MDGAITKLRSRNDWRGTKALRQDCMNPKLIEFYGTINGKNTGRMS